MFYHFTWTDILKMMWWSLWNPAPPVAEKSEGVRKQGECPFCGSKRS